MDYTDDKRIVLTLDAGGTNFVFSAMQGMKEVCQAVRLPAYADDLEKSLGSMIEGFEKVKCRLDTAPSAISFAFPGPADYPNGIIDNMVNLPAYAGGVALGPMLEDHFKIPVFINNDGDLFAYGEAMSGLLPQINRQLQQGGSPKRFENLFGITLGTGFGAGIVSKGRLYTGDNSAASEIWITRNKVRPECFSEEGASIRAVEGAYARITGLDNPGLTPKDICEIASGNRQGDADAAKKAFCLLGEVVGDALANAMTLMDGLIVIGGGLSEAYEWFIPSVLAEMNGTISSYDGGKLPRMIQRCYDLESRGQLAEFIKGQTKEIVVPGSDKTMLYDPLKRLGIGRSVLGTSQAVSVGACAFALNQLDQ